jgi:hypothetical protein
MSLDSEVAYQIGKAINFYEDCKNLRGEIIEEGIRLDYLFEFVPLKDRARYARKKFKELKTKVGEISDDVLENYSNVPALVNMKRKILDGFERFEEKCNSANNI